jgi:arylsulfatase A-like enzyme
MPTAWGGGAAGTGPLDLFKLTVGEGGIRNPMLIAGPGIEGKRRSDAFTYVWDVMPTILEYAGATHPTEFKGKKVEPMRGKPLNGMLAGSPMRSTGRMILSVAKCGTVNGCARAS